MFSFCRHVTTTARTFTLQRYLSSTRSILDLRKGARYYVQPVREELESVYKEDPYPSFERREIVAKDLGIPTESVTNWFQARRKAEKETRSLRGQDTSELRNRTRCTEEQLKILWDQCARNMYPDAKEMQALMDRLGLKNKTKVGVLLGSLRTLIRKGHLPADIVIPVKPLKLVRLPPDKIAILEDYFQRDPFPNWTGALNAVAQKTGLPVERVRAWFTKRRFMQKANPVRPLTKVMDKLQKAQQADRRRPWRTFFDP